MAEFGFETETGESPLLRFKGVLQSVEREERKYGEGTSEERSGARAVFNFVEVEVLESKEPYPFPIATISLPYNPKADTRWTAFADSARAILGPLATTTDLVGKLQEWAVMPARFWQRLPEPGPDGRDFAVAEGTAWKLVSIAGVEKEDLTEHLLALADGQTEIDYYTALMSDPKVMKRPDMVTRIVERKLLPAYLAGGLLTRDAEGVLHKV